MKVLVVGAGGREHALAWRLARCASVSEVIVAPGNPGMAGLRRAAVAVNDHAGLIGLARAEGVGLVVIGPDAALEAGLADDLAAAGVLAFGPSRAAAEVEWSKAFTKALCARAGIPTAGYAVFDDAASAKAALSGPGPFVLKADGLALGKGVVIAPDRRTAETEIDAMFAGRFGAAGARIVIEEFMEGEEISLFALCDGERAALLGCAQDHKRAFDGDEGPNTGGMGAYSPAPAATPAIVATAMETIVRPALAALSAMGRPYRGVLFAGLMLTADGPKLVEFNARFGDPETQALMALFEGDLALTLKACAEGDLTRAPAWGLGDKAAVAVVMAAQGYPDDPLKGAIVRGLPAASTVDGATVFSAGLGQDPEGRFIANGGRVLTLTGTGATIAQAADAAYAAAGAIDWPTGFYRRDIAWRALWPR